LPIRLARTHTPSPTTSVAMTYLRRWAGVAGSPKSVSGLPPRNSITRAKSMPPKTVKKAKSVRVNQPLPFVRMPISSTTRAIGPSIIQKTRARATGKEVVRGVMGSGVMEAS
jgi:hypothetical protein